jgi:NAD-dependent deacetylase
MAGEKKKLVVLTGAGMSAESGIPTFRGSDGLWENHRIEDVATFEAWMRDPVLVLTFYNERRKKIQESEPNKGHEILAKLEALFDVQIITQNIDDLHERAGSTKVLHLHGEIAKARSTKDDRLTYTLPHWEMKLGDTCELGSQLRPHIVWFGENVPLIEPAAELVAQADVVIVVGTSLQVYPAAGLIQVANYRIPKFIIDPHVPRVTGVNNLTAIEQGASAGLAFWSENYLSDLM